MNSSMHQRVVHPSSGTDGFRLQMRQGDGGSGPSCLGPTQPQEGQDVRIMRLQFYDGP